MTGRAQLAALVVVAACGTAAEAPATPWLYPAPRPRWPQPPSTGQLGSADVPIALVGAGIVAGPGVVGGPLVMRRLVGADTGPAEAALSGHDAAGPAIDLIDVDAGVARWRNRTAGVAVVAIGGARVFAAGGARVVVLDRATGVERARHAATWIGAGLTRSGDDVHAVVAVGAGVAVLGPDGRLGPVRAIPGAAGDLVAVCDDGQLWLLAWRAGRLERWDAGGAGFAVTWATPTPQPARADCGAAPVIVSGGAPREVRAIDAAGGELVGGPVTAADFWPARTGDGIELATGAGIERRPRSLATATRLESVAIDQLIAARGPRRLVLGADGGPVLLDGHGARALAAPAGDPIVVAGDRGLVAGPWRWPLGTQHPQPARFLWPADHVAATPGERPPPPLLGDPPRLDLPAPQVLGPGVATAAGAWAVGAVTFGPGEAERLYTIVLDDRPTADRGAGVAAFDLHAGRWRWVSDAGCPPGTPVGFAATAGVIVCGARGATDGAGAVRAIRASDGAPAWQWRGDTVDAVVAAGDAVAISIGAEAVIVDAATGAERGRWRSSDGFLPRLALVPRGGDTLVATLDHGAIVTRSLGLGLLPIDAVAVGGRPRALLALDGTLGAVLGDGGLYLWDPEPGHRAAGVLASTWHPRGDLAVAVGTNLLGDAVIVGVDADGIPRLAGALAGVTLGPIGVRAGAAGAPLAVAAVDGRVIVLAADGRALAIAGLPGADGGGLFSTVVDGAPVAGVVLAKPLRVILFALPG